MLNSFIKQFILLFSVSIVIFGISIFFLYQQDVLENDWKVKQKNWARQEGIWNRKRSQWKKEIERLNGEFDYTNRENDFINPEKIPHNTNNETHAFVIGFAGDIYEQPQWLGVSVVAQMLKEVDTRIEYILALNYGIDKSLPYFAEMMFSKLGIIVIDVDLTFIQEEVNVELNHIHHVADLWTRFLLFEMHQFDKIIYFDYNSLILHNIDHLFMTKGTPIDIVIGSNDVIEKDWFVKNKPPHQSIGGSDGNLNIDLNNNIDLSKIDGNGFEDDENDLIICGRSEQINKMHIGGITCDSCENINHFPSQNFFLIKPKKDFVTDHVKPYFKTNKFKERYENILNREYINFVDILESEFDFKVNLFDKITHLPWGLCHCQHDSNYVYTKGCTYMDDPWSDVIGRGFMGNKCVGDLYSIWLKMLVKTIPLEMGRVLR